MFCASCRGVFPIDVAVCTRDGTPLQRVEQVLAGRYVLKSVLGSGNMGTVYRATQLPMGREVAVKLMHSDLVRNPDLVARFEREAQAASTVEHPNAITVYDSGRSVDGQVYIAMELLEGQSLQAVLDHLTVPHALVLGLPWQRSLESDRQPLVAGEAVKLRFGWGPKDGLEGIHKNLDLVKTTREAVGDKVEIHPMMYLALSYDHRVVDGREAVSFLVQIKEQLEQPEKLLLGL